MRLASSEQKLVQPSQMRGRDRGELGCLDLPQLGRSRADSGTKVYLILKTEGRINIRENNR